MDESVHLLTSIITIKYIQRWLDRELDDSSNPFEARRKFRFVILSCTQHIILSFATLFTNEGYIE